MLAQILSLLAPLAKLILIDIIIGLIAFLIVGSIASSRRATFAVLKRNFLGYFANPTGYVFLCLFVLLTSMAAFWPHEFFNANLANLNQLNFWFPIIMLFFIPAITMSIWADEQRQGTDELLLTLPADDFDIVIGKYLSAASIYTVSLVFSQISTFMVLLFLSKGEVDTGLFFSNYLGYWFIGLAMLAIGMIASFLTDNLTVGFIFGAMLNAPLAFASMADLIMPNNWSSVVSTFSLNQQFDNFGRGVISVAPIAFFVLLMCLGLYVCMILIGRRHWSSGKEGNSMFLHFVARVILMAVILVSGCYFLKRNDFLRYDATEGQVSSLSPTTKDLIRDLKPERPIVIDAYISKEIPQRYAKTRTDLVTLLKEFESLASSNKVSLSVNIYENIETFDAVSQQAEKQYGIVPQNIMVQEKGTLKDQEVILAAAIRSGLSKVVVPFFESGIPVEYELVRSINTVAQPRRAKLGVINTDANFMGGVDMTTFQQIPKQPLIEELEKQYDVQAVDAGAPIAPDAYDVLMVVQPSSLSPQQLPNVVAAIEAGIPTAIFEDPLPAIYRGIPGTGEIKRAPGNPMMGGGGQPVPKGDMQKLWSTLGVDVALQPSKADGTYNPDILWQQYNPHEKLRDLENANDQWIFVLESTDEEQDFLSEKSAISAGLREIMFLYSGIVRPAETSNAADVTVTPLATTRPVSGLIAYEDLMTQLRSGQSNVEQLRILQGEPLGELPIAVLVEGNQANASEATESEESTEESAESSEDAEGEGEDSESTEGEAKDDSPAVAPRKMRAVYVADVDFMVPFFSNNRKRPEDSQDLDLRVQNISFVLNIIDVLAGELDYPAIRSHEPRHITLSLFEDEAEAFRAEARKEQKSFQQKFNEEIAAAEDERQTRLAEVQRKIDALRQSGATNSEKREEILRLQQRLQIEEGIQNRKLAVKRQQLEIERDLKTKDSKRISNAKINQIKTRYKWLALLLPPIPPLLVGAGVFVTRRVREREGISKSRLK